MSLSLCKQRMNSMVGLTPCSTVIGDRLQSALRIPCLPFLSEILHSDSIQWHAAQSLYLCCFFMLAAALLQTYAMRTENPVVHSSSTAAFLVLLCPWGRKTAYLLCNQARWDSKVKCTVKWTMVRRKDIWRKRQARVHEPVVFWLSTIKHYLKTHTTCDPSSSY